MVTLFFDRFTEIFPRVWIPFSFFFSIILQDLQNDLGDNTHHPIDMSRLCNVECVHIYVLNTFTIAKITQSK